MARRFAALALILCAGIAQAQVEYEDAGSFEVTQTGRIDGNYQRAEVLMPAPLDGPMQTVSDLVVEPPGVDLLVDEGKEVCLARMNIQEPGTSATLTIRYNIKCHPPRYDMQALGARSFPEYDRDSDLYRKYTEAEREIQTDDPGLQVIGARFVQQHAHPVARARAIFDFVMQSCSYMRDRPLSAVQMLQQRVGNCMAFSHLFVALCRAAGIPARVCGGAVVGEKDPWHQWAEFYLPEVGWVPADPTNGDENPELSDRFFGGLGGKPAILLYRGHDFAFKQGEEIRKVASISVGSVTWQGNLTHQFDFAATRVSPVRYCILFQSGRPESTVQVDLTEAEVTAALAGAREEGRQCLALSPAFRPAGLRYGVIWRKADDPASWVAYPRLTREQLTSLASTARANAMMPVSLSSCASESGEEVFAATFAPSQGADWVLFTALPADAFMAELRKQTQAGRVPGAIAAHIVKGQSVVTGLFATLTQSFSVQTSLWNRGSDFDAILHQHRQSGSVPIAVAVTDALPPYFHVVALNTGSSRDWWLARDVSGEALSPVLETAAGRGMQAVGISAY